MVIEISVIDKRPTVTGTPVIVCGNSDHQIRFTFDEEWDVHTTKTARFVYYRNSEVKSQEVVFTGDTVDVPVLTNILEVFVGVYAGALHTTTPARIPCDKSILCYGATHEAPPEDVYLQILEMLSTGELKGDKGDPGRTPVKGVDYFTDEDIQEVVEACLEALPAAEGVSF